MIPIQRNLDWMSRMMFYGSAIQIPNHLANIVVPCLDVRQDWPQYMLITRVDVPTVAGVTSSAFVTPPTKHRMIERWTLNSTFVAGDSFLASVGTGTAAVDVPLRFAATGAGSQCFDLLQGRPLYVPAGKTIYVLIGSVAGGTIVEHSIYYRELPEYQPMLPLS